MKTLRKFAVAFLAILGISAAVDVAATTYYKTIVPNTQFKGYVLFEQDVTFQGVANIVSALTVTAADLAATDDLTVGDDATVTGDLAVTGTTTISGGIVNASSFSSTANLERFYTGSKTLTEAGGAETVFTLTNATLQGTGGVLSYRILATDGTDHQARTGTVAFSCVNKAATTTAGVSVADETGSAVAVSTGTITYAITAGTAANACTVNFNMATSITDTSIVMFWELRLFGPGTIS